MKQLTGLVSNPTGVRDFFFVSVWTHFFSRANAQKEVLGILV